MRFILHTSNPLAIDSPDFLAPLGAKNDDSDDPQFRKAIYPLLPNPAKILDLGCAGGSFIAHCHDDGHFAVGLDGSDYNFKTKRSAWGTHPENFATCDISEAFGLADAHGQRLLFDLITAWEVLEHIKTERLHNFFTNVWIHLVPGVLFIGSINTLPDDENGYRYHQTVKNKEWWEIQMALRFAHMPDVFNQITPYFVRGPLNTPGAFNFVVRKKS